MKKLLLILLIFILYGCGQNSEPPPTLAISPIATPVLDIPPTFTPPKPSDRFFPTKPVVTVTQRAIPTQATDTPVPYADTVIEVHYKIPAIGLDRRLQGSVASQIILVDEMTGQAVQRNNQAGALLDLQSVLRDLLLPVVPDGCDTCVYLSYSLPLAQQSAEGWLRDPILLASLDNYFSLSLGPYFPPDTVAGLRRSASPFAPAHSVALTEDGRLYTWLGNENHVNSPIDAPPELLDAFADLTTEGLLSQYITSCAGSAVESLYIEKEDAAGIIGIICPEYTLPSTLLTLYSQFDDVLAEKLAASDAILEKPPTLLPLRAVLDYSRSDGARMTIFADGTAEVNDGSGEQVSTTISSTQVLSLTTSLIADGVVRTGLTTFDPEPTAVTASGSPTATVPPPTAPPLRTRLLVRGAGGVYDAAWNDVFDISQLELLNLLLQQLLQQPVAEPEPVETPDSTTEAAATEISEETPAPTPTEETPTPEVTPTP